MYPQAPVAAIFAIALVVIIAFVVGIFDNMHHNVSRLDGLSLGLSVGWSVTF